MGKSVGARILPLVEFFVGFPASFSTLPFLETICFWTALSLIGVDLVRMGYFCSLFFLTIPENPLIYLLLLHVSVVVGCHFFTFKDLQRTQKLRKKLWETLKLNNRSSLVESNDLFYLIFFAIIWFYLRPFVTCRLRIQLFFPMLYFRLVNFLTCVQYAIFCNETQFYIASIRELPTSEWKKKYTKALQMVEDVNLCFGKPVLFTLVSMMTGLGVSACSMFFFMRFGKVQLAYNVYSVMLKYDIHGNSVEVMLFLTTFFVFLGCKESQARQLRDFMRAKEETREMRNFAMFVLQRPVVFSVKGLGTLRASLFIVIVDGTLRILLLLMDMMPHLSERFSSFEGGREHRKAFDFIQCS